MTVTANDTGMPRICMPTWRRFTRRVYQCGLYEAQDVLVGTGDVDLLQLEPGGTFAIRDAWHRRLLYHDVSGRLVSLNPGLKRVRLERDYDLFVVMCQNLEDLVYISAIDGWRDHCKTTVCWVEEMWTASIPLYRHWLHALNQFDYVFTGAIESTGALSKATGRVCHSIAGAVDTLRFTPYPAAPPRTIDVYSIGRRSAAIHQALLQLAVRSEIFYVHDTIRAAATEALDHREHRDLLANIAKRSRCFLVAPAKMDAPGETRGQVEIGYRYYEGAAAGCVMLGQAPECDAFRHQFDWPDAVVEVDPDGSDVVKALRSLGLDRSRVRQISTRNATEALLRHDWIYRWKDILRTVGVQPSAGLAAREERLKQLAESMESMVA
jgi:hypothetical protein